MFVVLATNDIKTNILLISFEIIALVIMVGRLLDLHVLPKVNLAPFTEWKTAQLFLVCWIMKIITNYPTGFPTFEGFCEQSELNLINQYQVCVTQITIWNQSGWIQINPGKKFIDLLFENIKMQFCIVKYI